MNRQVNSMSQELAVLRLKISDLVKECKELRFQNSWLRDQIKAAVDAR